MVKNAKLRKTGKCYCHLSNTCFFQITIQLAQKHKFVRNFISTSKFENVSDMETVRCCHAVAEHGTKITLCDSKGSKKGRKRDFSVMLKSLPGSKSLERVERKWNFGLIRIRLTFFDHKFRILDTLTFQNDQNQNFNKKWIFEDFFPYRYFNTHHHNQTWNSQ